LYTFADAVKHVEDMGCRRAQDYAEAEVLLDLLTAAGTQGVGNYLEIGCRHGWTFGIVARMVKPQVMVGIDLPGVFPWGDEGSHVILSNVAQEARDAGIQAHILFADSTKQETLASLANLMDGFKFDCLFIDGDHKYAGVKADFENYSPFVRDGGVIIFHDIYPPKKPKEKQIEVDILWNELKTQYECLEIYKGGSGLGLLKYER
jgi:SAM-dependent methyltransferase